MFENFGHGFVKLGNSRWHFGDTILNFENIKHVLGASENISLIPDKILVIPCNMFDNISQDFDNIIQEFGKT